WASSRLWSSPWAAFLRSIVPGPPPRADRAAACVRVSSRRSTAPSRRPP
ncbi:MAG: hypothetical protein AVDCRST_MAG08-1748, partial [uncultured Acetobacteraceae bacterium]